MRIFPFVFFLHLKMVDRGEGMFRKWPLNQDEADSLSSLIEVKGGVVNIGTRRRGQRDPLVGSGCRMKHPNARHTNGLLCCFKVSIVK